MLALTVTELDQTVDRLYGFTLVRDLEQFKFLLLGFVLGVEPYYGVGYGQYQCYA